MKIRHGAIVDNVVTNVCVKFDDDRLWNEKALVLITTRRRTFVALGVPLPGLKTFKLSRLDSDVDSGALMGRQQGGMRSSIDGAAAAGSLKLMTGLAESNCRCPGQVYN